MYIRTLLLIFTLLFLSSCTKWMWSQKRPAEAVVISGYLIDKDMKNLAFIGKNYHFLFSLSNTTNKEMQNFLLWQSKTKKVPIMQSRAFYLNYNSIITGSVTMSIEGNTLNQEEIDWLEKHHFIKFHKVSKKKKSNFYEMDSNKKSSILVKAHAEIIYRKQFTLNGKRYKATQDLTNQNIKFKKSHTYFIVEADHFSDISDKVLATPMTLVADVMILTMLGVHIIMYPINSQLKLEK